MILMVKKLLEHFRKRIAKDIRTEKVIKKKGDKLYVKWEGYDNSFNSSIDKKHLV